jgi:hypothetical protein
MINIWCYWSQGISNIDLLGKLCLINWKKHISKKFKINFIDKNIFLSIQNDIDRNIFNKLTYQQQSDYVRLYFLYYFGGIYIDVTTILTGDLNWITDKFNKGFDMVGFKVNYLFCKKEDYLIENWCIAVKNKNNYIIKQWKQTFHNLLLQAYKNNSIKKSEIWIKTNKESIFKTARTYLTQHISHLYCMQNNNIYSHLFKKTVYLYNASSTGLISPLTDYKKLLNTLIFGIGYKHNFPLIKITRRDRTISLKYLCNGKFKNIINNELEYNYIKNSNLVQKILIIIFFIIIVIYLKFK